MALIDRVGDLSVTRSRIVIADAGPLIHLDELGCIGLLADFPEIRVPETVWLEVQQHRPQAFEAPQIRWVRCSAAPSSRVDALTTLYTLHAGEREALSLCLEFVDALLLSDDTAARLAAQSLAIQTRGTLGLLVRAMRRRQLSKAQVLTLLQQVPERSSLHIRPGLLADVIGQVAETPAPQ